MSLLFSGILLVLPAINTSRWFRLRLPGVGELIASGGKISFGSEFIAAWHDKTWFPAPDTDSYWIFGVGQDCTPLLSGYFCRPFRLRPSGLGFMPSADISVANWVLFIFSAGLAAYLIMKAPRRSARDAAVTVDTICVETTLGDVRSAAPDLSSPGVRSFNNRMTRHMFG